MSKISLNLVILRSADMESAARFYRRLGLEFVLHRHGSGPDHFAAELAGSVFEIYPLGDGEQSTLGTRIGFSVPSLDDAMASLLDSHQSLISLPKDSPWGRRAVVVDPDGHRIELVEVK